MRLLRAATCCILLLWPALARAQSVVDPRSAAERKQLFVDFQAASSTAASGGEFPAVATLRAIANMSTARAVHTMTPLGDGTVLIVGGMGASDDPTAGAQLFDPRTDRFVDLAAAAAPRKSHTATRLRDGKVLIAGGHGPGNTYLSTADLYDPATRTFTSLHPMTTARAGHEAVQLDDGRVLIIGGTGTGWTFLASAEFYDPRTRTFTATGNMNEPREGHVTAKLPDGRVLVAGGHRGRRSEITISRTAEIYDPVTGRFTPTGEMTVRRHKHDAVALPDGRVLVLGGADERDDRGTYTSTEIFDPAQGRFHAGTPMRLARYKHRGTSLLLHDGTLLLAGGAPEAELLDPATGRSTIVAGNVRMAGLFAAAAVLPAGRVLITGGYGGGTGPRARAWVFQPVP